MFFHSWNNSFEDVVVSVAPIVEQPLFHRNVVGDEDLVLKALVNERGNSLDTSLVVRKVHRAISNVTRLLTKEVELKKAARTSDSNEFIVLRNRPIEMAYHYSVQLRPGRRQQVKKKSGCVRMSSGMNRN